MDEKVDPTGHTVPVKTEALGISIESQVDNTRKIVFQTFIPQASSSKEIDVLLNKLLGCTERIGAANQMKVWKQKLVSDQGHLENFKKALGTVDARQQEQWTASNRQGKFKLTPQQEAERNACKSSIERYLNEIEIDKLNIAQYEQTLAEAKAE